MNKVEIKHNPYKIETEIIIDGEHTNNINLIELTCNRRLQEWVDDIIQKLMECLNSDKVEIEFTGTPTDYEDVDDAIKKHLNKYSICLKYKESGHPGAKLTAIKSLRDEAMEGPIDEFKTPEFGLAFESAINPDFEVSIQAPIKAGKSTFINAMIGHYLLPENIEACTATIFYIFNDDTKIDFNGCAYDFNGNPLSKGGAKQKVTTELLESWNSDKVNYVEIYGKIPTIKSKDIRLVLVDTPGPNNSQNKNHESAIKKFINDSDNTMVLYLLNITQFQTDDNLKYLRRIAEQMKKKGRKSSDRFLFVVTQTDVVDVEKQDIKVLVKNIRKYLNSQDISPARIIPVTAKFAKLTRMNHFGKHLTEDEKDDLDKITNRFLKNPQLNYLQYADATETVRDSIKQKIDTARTCEDKSTLMECYTGLAVVEATIQEFIEKYALPMKISDAHKAIMERVKEFNNSAQFLKSMTENEEKRKEINEQMKAAKKRQEDGIEFDKFIKLVKQNTRDDQETQIKEVLSNYKRRVTAAQKDFKNVLLKKGKFIEPSFVNNEESEFSDKYESILDKLEEELNEVVKKKFNKLNGYYEKYVQNILGGVEFNAPEVKISFSSLPKLDKLRSSATKSIVISRTYVKEFKGYDILTAGLTYIFRKKKLIERRGQRVDRKEYLDSVSQNIKTFLTKMETSIIVKTNQKVDDMIERFLIEAERCNKEIKSWVAKIADLTRSREDLIKTYEVIKKKKQWLDNFMAKMDDLIQI